MLTPLVALCSASALAAAPAQVPPPITGSPAIDTAPILEWPGDRPATAPNLTDPTSNTLFDLHADLQDCSGMDVVFSTEGNYHMALKDLWQKVLLQQHGAEIRNWFYTTSPPVFLDQVRSGGMLEIGNTRLRCVPSMVVGGNAPLAKIVALGVVEGKLIPLERSRGVVLLVKKGNPKQIRSVWDLARPDVRLVTPNPKLEPGAFDTYRLSIHGIAAGAPRPPGLGEGWTADRLYDAVFNSRDVPGKWLAGARIHHRDVPWSVALGKADVGVLLYHLARYTVESFPDQFEIVPLGGTADDPQPLPGTVISKAFVALIKGNWTPRQLRARNLLLEALQSDAFTQILQEHGLLRQ